MYRGYFLAPSPLPQSFVVASTECQLLLLTHSALFEHLLLLCCAPARWRSLALRLVLHFGPFPDFPPVLFPLVCDSAL